MNNFNFGEVLTRAWKTIWKHKVLWIFGILASCARGRGGGNWGGGGNSGYQTGPSGNMPFSNGQVERAMNQAGRFLEQNWWIIIVAILVLILIALFFYAIGMIGRIGLIKGTSHSEKGAERISFGELWSECLPYFWRIFGLNFLIGLVIFAIFVPLILLGVVTAGIGFVCLLPVFCLLIPIGWILSIIIEQAQAAIVLEDLGMLDGFKRGWEIVKTNAIPTILMSLILGIGSFIIGLFVAIPLLLAFIPALMSMNILRGSFVPLYISLACCALYMPVLIFFKGILAAYIQSAWTLTFMQLAAPTEETPVIIEANA
jgi:hypothetical protein